MSWENGEEIDVSFWTDRLTLPRNTKSIEDAIQVSVFTGHVKKVIEASDEQIDKWRQLIGKVSISDYSDPTKSARDVNREVVLENAIQISRKRANTIEGYTIDELRSICAPLLSIDTQRSGRMVLINSLRAWYYMEGSRVKSKSPPPSSQDGIKRIKRSLSPTIRIKKEVDSITMSSNPSESPSLKRSFYSYGESDSSTACTFESTHDEVTSAIALANTNKLPPHKYTEVVLAALASQYPVEMVRKGAKRFLNYY
eukprot:TRINITY_DN20092_c0_g1_i1.p1 TRINITY_DN20092_c0_g1~~TRINITY_DN20092_c0_g1_i1.p1  ORF type:complete len:255 (+),score=46.84 TRINITY_DN20092_c0_g1_i1:41-805(+)